MDGRGDHCHNFKLPCTGVAATFVQYGGHGTASSSRVEVCGMGWCQQTIRGQVRDVEQQEDRVKQWSGLARRGPYTCMCVEGITGT